MLPIILGGIALVGVGAWIYNELQEQSGVERERWRSKREEVERSIQWHEFQINNHLSSARNSYDFKVLVDMHFSCMKVADQAYSLLKDARISQKKIGEAIGETKIQMGILFEKKMSSKSFLEKNKIQDEISSLQNLRSHLFNEKKQIENQKLVFESRVKDLNAKTHELKISIRDRTGQKGMDWYARLELRKQLRNNRINYFQ